MLFGLIAVGGKRPLNDVADASVDDDPILREHSS